MVPTGGQGGSVSMQQAEARGAAKPNTAVHKKEGSSPKMSIVPGMRNVENTLLTVHMTNG